MNDESMQLLKCKAGQLLAEIDGAQFALESATASQLAAEQERQRQREEIARRMAKPLKGGGAVNVQPQFDFGQTGQMDLFAPIAEARA